MFNFYVVLGGHNKVSDTGRVTTCRLICKAPSLKTKTIKNVEPFENMSFSKKNRLKVSTKKIETNFYPRANNPVEHTASKNNNWIWPL